MMSEQLQLVINQGFNEAQSLGYEYFTVEQLLLALLNDPNIIEMLRVLNINVDKLSSELISFIEQNLTYLPDHDDRLTEPTVAFQRIFERAIVQVQSSEKSEVNSCDILVAMLTEQESYACFLLQSMGLDWLTLTRYLSHQILPSMTFDTSENEGQQEMDNPLARYTINLNHLAKNGRLDPLVGRELDIERVMQILCRRRKNNPILVGEAGVGKTAIAEGLAWLIEQHNVPEILADAIIYSFDLSALIAGTTYRGDFEKRFNDLVKALEKQPNSILFIDEIHMIIGAGATSESQLDTANLFKPLLSSGKLRVIGSTTYQEYGRIFAKDHALERRFQKIDIIEPSVADTIKILQGLKKYYEKFHHVKYTSQSLKSAVELSVKYLPSRFLPDKAIDLIDEAGAKNTLLPIKQRKKTINTIDIEKVIAKVARIPETTVSSADKTKLQTLCTQLKSVVFGQDNAIDALSDAINLNRSGLGTEHKPIGSFLFAGPTGVGKTEVTIQLASELAVPLLRFDMSEYKEPHTISRLIGSPPGYVGYEQGGLLTEQVIKHPHAVLLLDEIEKAHPDIYNLLLQIMDNGTLTDSNGRKVEFRNIILVMTTNAGVQETVKSSIGFSFQDKSHDAMFEIKRIFSPEFRNRLDNIIWFEHLNKSIIRKIVDKFMCTLSLQLKDKEVDLSISDSAKAWLVEKGYDSAMGARPMSRVIQEQIKKPLANELLFGQLQHDGSVKIDVKKDKLFFVYSVK